MITNESIMDATLKMIATHGIKGATTRQLAEAVSLILNSVILLVMVEKVKSDVHDRPPLIDINAETLTEVLRRIVKKQ